MSNNVIGIRIPLRVSLFGGGTDFPGYIEKRGYGSVVSFGIDKYIYLFLKKRRDSKVRLSYSVIEEVEDTSQLSHEICKTVLLERGITNGIEIHSMADISSKGSGLGSSSAYTVALLHATAVLNESIYTTGYALASEACRIEVESMSKPIGYQDQWACALGNLNQLTIKDGDSVKVERLIGSSNYIESVCSLYYTGNTRIADTILSEQCNNLSVNLDLLDEMRSVALFSRSLIQDKKTKSLGLLLRECWDAKSKLSSSISTPEIDNMVSLSLENGAIGSKICGAGGGGYLLCISQPENKERLSSRMEANGYSELPFKIDIFGSNRIL